MLQGSEVFYCCLCLVTQTNDVWYVITVSSHLLRIWLARAPTLKRCMYDVVFVEAEVLDLRICSGVSLLGIWKRAVHF